MAPSYHAALQGERRDNGLTAAVLRQPHRRIDETSCLVPNLDGDVPPWPPQPASALSFAAVIVEVERPFVSARYLYQYAAEAAWKEDNRRMSNGDAFRRTLSLAMSSPVSRQWKGYWERNEG